jgi:hypothetical protein
MPTGFVKRPSRSFLYAVLLYMPLFFCKNKASAYPEPDIASRNVVLLPVPRQPRLGSQIIIRSRMPLRWYSVSCRGSTRNQTGIIPLRMAACR